MKKEKQKTQKLFNGMKRLFKLGLLFIFLLSGSLWSCSEDEGHTISQQELSSHKLSSQIKLKGSQITFDSLFEKIAKNNLKIKKENILYIDYTINEEGNISILNIKESEPTWPIVFAMIDIFHERKPQINKNYLSGKDKYQVSCSKGWNERCGGGYSCGRLVEKCLDSGGCAEVCKLQMVYNPENKTFYLIDKE